MPPVHAFGVVLGLQQEWRHATHDHRLAHALGTVPSEVACDLAAAHRESDQREILQLQVRDQLVQVLCECVVVVAVGRPAGSAETSTVVGDDSISRIQQRRHLFLPGALAVVYFP